MALRLIEGMDHYNSLGLAALKGWQNSGGTISGIYGVAGRINGECLALQNGNIKKILGATLGTEIIIGAAILPNAALSGLSASGFRVIDASSTSLCTVSVNSAGQVTVQNGSGSVVATGTQVVAQGSWFYAELHVKFAGAASTVATQVNGVSDIATTTVTLGSSSAQGVEMIVAASPASMHFDDLYVLDTAGGAPWNAFLGDVHVDTGFAGGDGATLQWTPSTGVTHYTLVNENPPDGDSSYVSSSTVGQIDTYTFPSLPILTGTVYGVQTNLYARKDAASTRAIEAVIRSAGTNYTPGSSQVLAVTYQFYTDIFVNDPATSAQWTISGVNNAQFGEEVTT